MTKCISSGPSLDPPLQPLSYILLCSLSPSFWRGRPFDVVLWDPALVELLSFHTSSSSNWGLCTDRLDSCCAGATLPLGVDGVEPVVVSPVAGSSDTGKEDEVKE